MKIKEKLIRYQNRAEENYAKKKSFSNAIHYFFAFGIFISSTMLAGISMPFRMLLKFFILIDF